MTGVPATSQLPRDTRRKGTGNEIHRKTTRVEENPESTLEGGPRESLVIVTTPGPVWEPTQETRDLRKFPL